MRTRSPVAGVNGTAQDDFRVVRHANALGEVRPGPIEDELALAVFLEVRRRCRYEPFASPERQVGGGPPRVASDAPGFLEHVQPCVLHERGKRPHLQRASHALAASTSRTRSKIEGCKGRRLRSGDPCRESAPNMARSLRRRFALAKISGTGDHAARCWCVDGSWGFRLAVLSPPRWWWVP